MIPTTMSIPLTLAKPINAPSPNAPRKWPNHLSAIPSGRGRRRPPYACPHGPRDRQPALFDEAVPRAAFVLHTVLNARLNHRPAHRLAAMLDNVRDGSLDAGPDRRDGVDPAGSNMSPWLAALTLQFRSHAGLHDRPSDGCPAFPDGACAGMRDRLLRDHGGKRHQQSNRKSCKQAPAHTQGTGHLSASRHRR